MAQIVFIPLVGGLDMNPIVETFAGVAYNMTNSDANKIIRCTNGAAITVNVQPNQAPGTTAEFVAEGAGAISVVGAGGLTIRKPAFFLATTAQQYSTVVVTILDDNEAVIRGDLLAA